MFLKTRFFFHLVKFTSNQSKLLIERTQVRKHLIFTQKRKSALAALNRCVQREWMWHNSTWELKLKYMDSDRPPKDPEATQVQGNTPELHGAYGTCRLQLQKRGQALQGSTLSSRGFSGAMTNVQLKKKGGTLLFLLPHIFFPCTEPDVQLYNHPELFSGVFQVMWRFPTFAKGFVV